MATYAYTFTSGDTITPTKLNNARTVSEIVNADIKSDAAIAGSKLADGAITNAKVDAAAAIAGTKIAPDFGTQAIATTNSLSLRAATTATVGVDIGNGRTGDGFAYLDLIGDATYTDYGLRLVRGDGGANTISSILHRGTGALQITAADAAPITFSTSTAERMRITSDGAACFGVTSQIDATTGSADGTSMAGSAVVISRNNNIPLRLRRMSGDGAIVEFRRDTTVRGSISVSTTATTYNTTSDYRLKQNVEPMVGGLAKLAALAPKTFEFINEPNVKVDGFIAHEVQAVVPQAVTGEKDGEEMQGLDHSKLVPVLVAAVQELSAKVAALEAAQS
jgi:hypothetical protein